MRRFEISPTEIIGLKTIKQSSSPLRKLLKNLIDNPLQITKSALDVRLHNLTLIPMPNPKPAIHRKIIILPTTLILNLIHAGLAKKQKDLRLNVGRCSFDVNLIYL